MSPEEIEEISQPPGELFQSGFEERYWLRNHGKEEFISFTDNALLELRKYFESLDETGTGSIGVEQLEDPFIAFGLSESREEVAELIKSNACAKQRWTWTARAPSSSTSFWKS